MHQERLLRQQIRKLFINLLESGISRNMSWTSKHSAKYRNNKNYPFHKGIKYEQEISLDEISPEQVHIPKEYIHQTLNPAIWEGDKLKLEVRRKMLKIAKEFYLSLEISAPIKDIKFIGSMANYNWSSQSDLDIHIFFDFKQINEDIVLVKNYLDAKKTIWNDVHEIKLKGYDVELYSQDLTEKNASIGVYSLLRDEWESKPTIENFQIDKTAVVTKIVSIVDQIEQVTDHKLPAEEIYEKGEALKARIKKMRQCGLEEGGEFSVENLAFKYLRNNGYLEALYDTTRKAYDKTLSLS